MSEFLTPTMTVIALSVLAAFAVGGLAFAIFFSRIRSVSVADRRLSQIKQNIGVAGPASRVVDVAAKRRKAVQESLRELDIKERAKAKSQSSPPLELRLEQAGLTWSRSFFYMFGAIVGAVFSALAWFLGAAIYIGAALAAAGALGFPYWFVNFLRKRRFKAFTKEFPNAVDIIVRGVKAGLPLNDCLRMVATESNEPVRGEFHVIHERQSMGMTVAEAITELPGRVPIPEATFFAIAITIQQQSGGNLAEALGNLSKVLRERAKMRGKIRAMSMEAKASAVIIALLPIIAMILVYLTSPDYIMVLFTDSVGNAILVASAFWMSMGVFAMKKMINFDFWPAMSETIINSVTDPQIMIAALAAVAVVATILTLTMPLLATDKLARRIKTVATEREEFRARERAKLAVEATKRASVRNVESTRYVKGVVERFNLRKALADRGTVDRLRMAGFRGQAPLTIFLFARLILPLILFVAAIIYLFVLGDYEQPPLFKIVVALIIAYIGFYAPNLYVRNRASKRQTSVKRSWPDALDVLLICVESGMSVEASFKRVSEEIGTQSAVLAEELMLTAAELSYLSDRRMAYENLAARTGLDGVKAVTMALVQAERYGTPVGQSLRIMAQENRDMRMNAAEKKAAALPPKLTVPMILFFLPVLFGVILGPAAIELMDQGFI